MARRFRRSRAGPRAHSAAPWATALERVIEIFFEAWRLAVKGVTVFRDGSRESQVLAFGERALDAGELRGGPARNAAGTPVKPGACSLCAKCGDSACA